MASPGTISTQKLAGLLAAPGGLTLAVAGLATRDNRDVEFPTAEQIVQQNIGPDLLEKRAGIRYPLFHVYCEKIENDLREKFRRFSGRVQLAVEIRVSSDRMEDLAWEAPFFVDAVTEVLDGSRGDWGLGVYYPGGYQVTFGPAKAGGKHLLQTAKIQIELLVSTN